MATVVLCKIGLIKNVQHIQASFCAFAAILADASVVTWGNAASGGDSRAVEAHVTNVLRRQASVDAFAAIRGGSVVIWGSVGSRARAAEKSSTGASR